MLPALYIKTSSPVATPGICLRLSRWELKDPLHLQPADPLILRHQHTRAKIVAMPAATKASPSSQAAQFQIPNHTIDPL
jgi:hypothetical protein